LTFATEKQTNRKNKFSPSCTDWKRKIYYHVNWSPIEGVPKIAGLLRITKTIVWHREACVVRYTALSVFHLVISNVDKVGDHGGERLNLLHKVVPELVISISIRDVPKRREK
jgi:hypothetical protein